MPKVRASSFWKEASGLLATSRAAAAVSDLQDLRPNNPPAGSAAELTFTGSGLVSRGGSALLARRMVQLAVVLLIDDFIQSRSVEIRPTLRRTPFEADELHSAHRRDVGGGRTICGNCGVAVGDGAHGSAPTSHRAYLCR
jgi:hypothetical protein